MGSVRGLYLDLCGAKPCGAPTPVTPPVASCPECADADWSTDRPVTWSGSVVVTATGGALAFPFPGSDADGGSAGCDTNDCDVTGDWTIVLDGQTSGPEQSISAFLGEFWTQSGDVPSFSRYSPYVHAIWGGVGATVEFKAFETDGFASTFVMDDDTAAYRLQPDIPFRLTIFKTGTAHFRYQGQQPLGTVVFDFAGDGTGDWDADVLSTLSDPLAVTSGRRIGAGVWWSAGVTGATGGDAAFSNVAFAFGGGG